MRLKNIKFKLREMPRYKTIARRERIAYIFLPSDLYFKIMKYERYIMIAFIVLLASGIIDLPLGVLTGGMMDFFYNITGMPEDLLAVVISNIVSRLPEFSL